MVLSSAGIVVLYHIGRLMYSKRVGLYAAFFYAIHGLIIELSAGRVATDHIDVFFLFFIELAIFVALLYAKNPKHIYLLFCGISIGLAVLSKWLPAFIVFPVFMLLLLQEKKYSIKQIFFSTAILFVVACITFLPWQIYIFKMFPLEAQVEAEHNMMYITQELAGLGGSVFFHFNMIRMSYGELIYLPLIWFLIKYIKKPGALDRAMLLVWILVPYLFFSFVKTKMQGYTLFCSPAMFIILGLFLVYLKRYYKAFKYKWVAAGTAVLLVLLPVRYSIERVKPFDKMDRAPMYVSAIKKLPEILPENEKVIVLNFPYPIQAMFYTDYTFYERLPRVKKLRALSEEGYDIFVFDDGVKKLEDYSGIKNITFFNFEGLQTTQGESVQNLF